MVKKRAPRNSWTLEKLTKEALKYSTRMEFKEKHMGAYMTCVKRKCLDDVCKHMSDPRYLWDLDTLKQEALKYKTKKEFQTKNRPAYAAAQRQGLINDICGHMLSRKDQSDKRWTKENIIKIAKKYKHRKDFANNNFTAYKKALENNVIEAFEHMDMLCQQWDEEKITKEAKKYKLRSKFKQNACWAYTKAKAIGILDDICSHMDYKPFIQWNKEKVKKEAIKHKTKQSFRLQNTNAYSAALRLNILEEACKHMEISISEPESSLFNQIKQKYPKAQKLMDRKVNIKNKPHIQGFEIDIYIPELRKGIEFDGDYWHSIEGLKRGRPEWPKEDLKNYHKIKDGYFNNKGIEILHIQENEWIENSDECIEKIEKFLQSDSKYTIFKKNK